MSSTIGLSATFAALPAFWKTHCTLCISLLLVALLVTTLLTAGVVLLARLIIRKRSGSQSRARAARTPPHSLRLPELLSERAPTQTKAPWTLAALLAPSSLLATAPIRLGLMPSLSPSTLARMSLDFACCGLNRSASWGRAAFDLFGPRDGASTDFLDALERGDVPLGLAGKTPSGAPEDYDGSTLAPSSPRDEDFSDDDAATLAPTSPREEFPPKKDKLEDVLPS